LLAMFDGELLRETSYPSAAFDSLEAVLAEFIGHPVAAPATLSLALAGPVRGDQAHVTNLDWPVDADSLRKRFGFERVRLTNDVAAIRQAIPVLPGKSIVTLQAGEPDVSGTIAVVAPGTGLGFAADGIASEGGHASFAPVTALQARLLSWMQERQGHVSREDVCSGRAMPAVREFLRRDPEWSEEVESLDTPSIVASALDGSSALSAATLELWIEILGGIVGDWALEVAATGGIYLAGGLSARLLPLLQRPAFLAAFREHGRMEAYLRRVPVQVVTEERAALLGARLGGVE